MRTFALIAAMAFLIGCGGSEEQSSTSDEQSSNSDEQSSNSDEQSSNSDEQSSNSDEQVSDPIEEFEKLVPDDAIGATGNYESEYLGALGEKHSVYSFTILDLDYDVQQSDSLDSPHSGYILIDVETNESAHYLNYQRNEEWDRENQFVRHMRYEFVFQDSSWTFKNLSFQTTMDGTRSTSWMDGPPNFRDSELIEEESEAIETTVFGRRIAVLP